MIIHESYSQWQIMVLGAGGQGSTLPLRSSPLFPSPLFLSHPFPSLPLPYPPQGPGVLPWKRGSSPGKILKFYIAVGEF